MIVTTSFGNYGVGFRYIDNVTVAVITEADEPCENLEYSQRMVGAAFYNFKDAKDGTTPLNREVGQVLAIRRALACGCIVEEEADEFVATFKALAAHFRAK